MSLELPMNPRKKMEPMREGKCNWPTSEPGKRCRHPKGKCPTHKDWGPAPTEEELL